MHRALLISEILDIVLSQFDTEGPGPEIGRLSLIALVKTCKAFTEPALDALWRDQYTLNNVLRCLPPDAWSVEKENPDDGWSLQLPTISITRPLRPEDWDMVSKFLPRVKNLRLAIYPYLAFGHFPTVSALAAIESYFGPTHKIFPNLRQLTWIVGLGTARIYSPFANLFLAPHVRVAELVLFGAELQVLPELMSLQNVEILDLSTSHDSPNQRTVCSRIALQLTGIRTLGLMTIDGEGLKHLSTLDTLQSLTLHNPVAGDCGSSLGPLSSDLPPFASLRRVHLWETTFEFASEFLRSAGPTLSLKEFRVGTSRPATGTTIARLLSLVGSHLDHLLDSLAIGEPEDGEGTEAPPPASLDLYVLDGAALLPLSRFSNLTIVFIQSSVGLRIDDTILWELAPAWPKLKQLELNSGSHTQVPPSTTLDALRALAKFCPDLSAVCMPVDASSVPAFEPYRDDHISQETLKSYHFQQSPISDPAGVAAFLSDIFPNMTQIQTTFDEDNDEEMEMVERLTALWKEVRKLLPAFASVRRQEQHYGSLARRRETASDLLA
ncbi:hypothetical protein C8F01DRAFT_195809 [Mycena amicta]|nr:hypothetical protein C8F01DRAFT_195809 [Mycena amicta]